jgi:hypothetical protein
VNKLRTTAIGIGLTLTLAGCGGGGGAPAAALVQTTTTTVKLVSKNLLLTDADKMCDAAGLTFADLRTQAGDLVNALKDGNLTDGERDDQARDFLINTAIPPIEKVVGAFRVVGTPNRDGREYARFNLVLSDAMVEMKNETQKAPQDALADLAAGPDKAVSDPTRAGEAFANANDLAAAFGFKTCGIF